MINKDLLTEGKFVWVKKYKQTGEDYIGCVANAGTIEREDLYIAAVTRSGSIKSLMFDEVYEFEIVV